MGAYDFLRARLDVTIDLKHLQAVFPSRLP